MITAGYGALGLATAASAQVRTQLDKLTAQAASGHVADSYGGLGAAARVSLNLQGQLGHLDAAQSAVGAVTGRMGVAQTALTQISQVASDINAKLAELNDVTPSQIDSVAQEARLALQQVAGLLNTTDGSVYVFGGTDTATAPVPDADDIATSPFTSQIAAAVSGLAANGAAATASATLSVASSDAAGTTPFAGAPGTPPTVLLGTGAARPVGVLANANVFATSGGSSTTGSFMRDILRGLATVASLSSGQVTATGFTALVQDTRTSLSGAIGALGTEEGALGDTQSALTADASVAGDTATALKTQLSSVDDVDMASTLSDLSATQTQLSASYKLISEMSQMSLVSFL